MHDACASMNMILIIISSEAIFSDAWLMAGGYILMFGYTILMLGRWNAVEVIVCTHDDDDYGPPLVTVMTVMPVMMMVIRR